MSDEYPSRLSGNPKSDNRLSRREFARRAAFAATTAVVLPASLLSQETAPKPTPSTGQPPQAATDGDQRRRALSHRSRVGGTHPHPPVVARGTYPGLSRPLQEIWPPDECVRHANARSRIATSARSASRDRPGTLSRAVARYSLCCEGPARGCRISHNVGSPALSETALRSGCNRYSQAARCWCHIARQRGDDRIEIGRAHV